MKSFLWPSLKSCAVLVLIALALAVMSSTGADAQTNPVVHAFSFTPQSVDVSINQATVTFTMNVTDTAGIANVYVYVSNGSFTTSVTLYDSTVTPPITAGFTGTLQNANLTANLTIYGGTPPGPWTVSSIYIGDLARNTTTLATSDLTTAGFPSVLTVIDNPSAPKLTGFSFSPSTVDVTNGSQTVTFNVSAQDSNSADGFGIAYVLVSFIAPTSCLGPEAGTAVVYAPSAGSSGNGVWTGQITIPQFDVVGNWSAYVEVHDTSGTYLVFHVADLNTLGLPSLLTVNGPPNCAALPDSISGTVHYCRLNGSGVAGVTITLYNTAGVLVGTATTNASGQYTFSGLMPGTYSLIESVPAGYRAMSANPGVDSGGTVVSTSEISVGVVGADTTFQPNDFVICPSCGCSSTISSNFNGTAIGSGDYIWFNAVFSANNLNPSGTTTIMIVNQTITFSVGSTNYSIPVPDSTIVITKGATTAATMFSGGEWMTAVPTNTSGNTFLSGVGFQVPAGGIPGGINPVNWTGTFLSDTTGVKINWQWAAAVYSSGFGALGLGGLGVKATDDNHYAPYANSDHAGTPENAKNLGPLGGARGGGGSNYTGSYSGTGSVVPCPMAK